MSSYLEPLPGWIDLKALLSGPLGGLLGTGLGIIHLYYIKDNIILAYAPVDLVNNAIITAGWDAVEQYRVEKKVDNPIYAITSYEKGYSFKDQADYIKHDDICRLITPKSVYYAWAFQIQYKFLYIIFSWIIHYIPAYVVDFILDILKARPKGIPRLVAVYNRLDKVTELFKYFIWYDWNFKHDKLKSMISRMSTEDRIIFNCDINTVDSKEYVKCMVIGIRRYIIQDNLEGSVYGHKKQKWLLLVHIMVTSLYAYLIWKVFYIIYCTFMMIL